MVFSFQKYAQTFAAPRSRILSNRDRNVNTVILAAMMALTGSARKTANTGSGRRCGRRKKNMRKHSGFCGCSATWTVWTMRALSPETLF